MRVTQETFYRQTMYNLLRMRYGEYVTNGQMAGGKRIMQPSDDPVGSVAAQGSHRMLEEIDQYSTTVQHARDWLSQADSSMQSMSDYLAQVKTKAEQAGTGTYTSQQLDLISKDAQIMLAHLVSLGNAQVDGKYIFAGSKNDLPAVTNQPQVKSPAEAAISNTGDGRLYGQGVYTGRLSRTVTLTVTAVTAGSVPANLSYSYVDDFGRSISGNVNLTGTGTSFGADVGDGVQVYLDQGAYAVGDAYTLTIGRNQGNQEDLNANLSWNYRLRYNFTMDNLYRPEGYRGGKWNNILDLVANWQDALAKDNKVQDYFEAVPGRYNNPGTSAKVQVGGDYDELIHRQVQFQVGGPLQFKANDPTLTDATVQARNYRFYLANNGFSGQPSAANPMILNYVWQDPALAWHQGTVTVTGTGPDNALPMPDNGGDVSLVLAQANYDTSKMGYWDGTGALPPPATGSVAPPATIYRAFGFYPAKTEPSPATPVNMTYTYQDDSNQRRFGTIAFTGTGASGAWTVPLNSSTLNVASNVSTSTLSDRQYEFYMNDLQAPPYPGGQPSAANPLELHYRYWDSATGAWVDGGIITVTGTGPEHMTQLAAVNPGEDVRIFLADGAYDSSNIGTWPPGASTTAALTMTSSLAGQRATLTLSQDGVLNDGDSWTATLEQYQQGQKVSQETLAEITDIQASLLKQNGDAGARLNNLEVRDSLLDSDKIRLNDRLSKVEDADVTEVTTNLTLYQTLYQAALQATAMVTSRTLADYL